MIEHTPDALKIFVRHFPVVGRGSHGNDRLAQSFSIRNMNRDAVQKTARTLLRMIHVLPERIIDDSQRNLPFFIERQRHHAVLVIVNQVGSAVYGVKNPVCVPGHLMQPFFLSQKLDIGKAVPQLTCQKALDIGVHLRHIVRKPLDLHVPGPLPVVYKGFRLLYQRNDLLHLHFIFHPFPSVSSRSVPIVHSSLFRRPDFALRQLYYIVIRISLAALYFLLNPVFSQVCPSEHPPVCR